MHRVGVLTGHVVRSGKNVVSARRHLPLLREALRSAAVAGGSDDDDDDDDWDDELDALLAAQALGAGDDDDDILGLDDPTEAELLEQLASNDAMIANPAVSALRQLWREAEGPFASDDLDDSMGHLRARVTSPEQALRAITKSVDALKLVVAEYPDWPEPLNELATCELLRANPDESVRMSLRVLGKQPAHFDCLARLSLSYAIIGNSAEASDSVDKLEKICPILAKPLRQLVAALSAAVEQAQSGDAGGDEAAQIRLEIDAETLESLGPILEGMGGFGDAMQGLGGGMEGGDFSNFSEQDFTGEEGADLLPDEYEDLDDGDLPMAERSGLGLAEGEDPIPEGAEVALVGLESFPEMNGVTGTNRGFDEARGRYVVELADGRQIAARPGNVQSAEEAWEGSVKPRMERVLEEAEQALDEMEAKMDGEDLDGGGEDRVVDDGGETEGVVLEFEIGGRVELMGLQSARQHNGKTGTFRGVDEDNGRFVVELDDDGVMLAIKPENLRPL